MSDGNLITKMLADAAAEAEKEKYQSSPVEEPQSADDSASAEPELPRASPKQHVYSPQFLLSLKESPLCLEISHLNLPENKQDFFLLNLPKRSAFINNNPTPNNKFNNQRGKRDRRKDPKDQKDSKEQRDHHKDKDSRKAARDHRQQQEETPEWVLKSDVGTGNSIQDFERWRLKMRIETFKRNGEPVPAEDLQQYEYLTAQQQDTPQKPPVAQAAVQAAVQPALSEEAMAMAGSSGSSRFSSFFGPGQVAQTKDDTKLLSLLQRPTQPTQPAQPAQPAQQAQPGPVPVAFPPGLAPFGPLTGTAGPPIPSRDDMFFNSLLSKAPAPGPAPFLPPGLFLPFSEKK
ncbi:hypothetical protein OGAPHI_001826 [Ogataea philodendri]|uniref:Uncharacterized protein n=1 Tax=Ogataea philodendri TaxID=1378263 RepID=A0A9P8P9V5_9ASCO|nr:uncharacterized protein OGAPHI_001826 [Ogataea philodendri]KAH3668072.1 hypothetical protein OGAPHI_001826 [Ogataea philodendri]